VSSRVRLILAFAFSFFNFALLVLSGLFVGGLDHWSVRQFAGLYGLIETSTGIANLVAPNFWALPVSEFRSRSETVVVVALADLRVIHVDGVGRVLGGGLFLAWSAAAAGVRLESLLLLPLTTLLGLTIIALSGLVARWGIARPDIDVLQLKVYWRNREKVLPPISLGTSYLQFFLTLVPLPIAAATGPRFLFHPEFYPSLELAALTLVVTLIVVALFLAAWSSRVAIRPVTAPARSERVINPAAVDDSSEQA
jgi:hypothetical protein